MAVKYLSDEWMKECQTRLNSHEGFQSAAKGQSAKLQQVVTDAPGGEIRYWFSLDAGKVGLGGGDIEGADATLTQSYETSCGLSKNELTGQAAFMQGKLKIAGNLMKIMQLQGVFTAMPTAVADLKVDY